MKKTISIDGMTCEHCSAKVKGALESLDNVDSAKISLFRKNAVVEGEDLSDDVLKDTVEKSGYKVNSIK